MWLVPSAFVGMMAVGGALGIASIDVPFVELGIALSVVILGLAVALQWNLPVAAAMALVGFSRCSTVTLTARRCRWIPGADLCAWIYVGDRHSALRGACSSDLGVGSGQGQNVRRFPGLRAA